MTIKLLYKFAYVRALRNEIQSLVTHCLRCHGTGKLFIVGGTISCPLCHRWRDLLAGKY